MLQPFTRWTRARLLFFLLPIIPLSIILVPPRAQLAGAPTLLSKPNSTRAVAVESINFLAEPFSPTRKIGFGQDNRTRVMLFASNLNLFVGEPASAVTVDAEDGNHLHYSLAVEYVGPVPGFAWMNAVIVRLPDNIGDVGDVLVGITLHGAASNRVRVGIGHIGGGPPDDAPPPEPVPDLGPGASLHGKQLFPSDNAWNEDISNSPVDPNSDNIIANIGANTNLHPDFGTVWNGAPNGIPYVVVAGGQP